MTRPHSISILFFAALGLLGILLICAGAVVWCADWGLCLPSWELPAFAVVPENTPTRPAAGPPPTEPTVTIAVASVPAPSNVADTGATHGQIAYAYGMESESEIYLMNSDGSNPRRLTFNDYPDDAPTFSPDGNRLAFASARADGWEIYTLDLITLAETQITNLPDKARFPSWSPVAGDERILFERRSGQGLGIAIWVVRADGGGLESVTGWGAHSRPSWSPDGAQVIFGRALGDTTGEGKITSSDFLDVFVLDLANGQESNLTNSPDMDDHNVAWSPDGLWIAYTSVSGVTGLSAGRYSMFSPTWSPDSRQIAFVNNLGQNWNEIWIINRDGSDAHSITAGGPFFHPEWSK